MSGRRGAGAASGLLVARQLSNLSEAERDEWRGYFDRMLERLHRLGYTPERNPWSILLEMA